MRHSYFDPTAERRVDGLDAMRKRLEPMKKITPVVEDASGYEVRRVTNQISRNGWP